MASEFSRKIATMYGRWNLLGAVGLLPPKKHELRTLIRLGVLYTMTYVRHHCHSSRQDVNQPAERFSHTTAGAGIAVHDDKTGSVFREYLMSHSLRSCTAFTHYDAQQAVTPKPGGVRVVGLTNTLSLHAHGRVANLRLYPSSTLTAYSQTALFHGLHYTV